MSFSNFQLPVGVFAKLHCILGDDFSTPSLGAIS